MNKYHLNKKTSSLVSGPSGKTVTGFTLVELLVVLGIIGILAVVVVLILNPATLFAQARDARRVEDIRTLASALRLGQIATLDIGEDNTVYISVPDENPGCSDLSLPDLEPPFLYKCVPNGSILNTDGTGWIPIDFSDLENMGITISSLPIDPTDEAQSGFYYTYSVVDQKWKLTALLESVRYASVAQSDNGIDSTLYEVGLVSKLGPSLARGK